MHTEDFYLHWVAFNFLEFLYPNILTASISFFSDMSVKL